MSLNIFRMHEAIGRAVLMAQVFETIIVVCIELVLSMRKVDLGENPEPINPNRFKVPTKALLKELAARNDIDTTFESRIWNLVEKRYLLIHRWYLENGLPGDEDIADIKRLTDLAIEVESGCRRTIAILTGYVVKWLTGENQEDIAFTERLSKAERIFHDAHKFIEQDV